MKRTRVNRIIALLLTVMMVVTYFPAISFAAGEEEEPLQESGQIVQEETTENEIEAPENETQSPEDEVQEPEEVYTRIDLRAAGPLSILAERARTPFRS